MKYYKLCIASILPEPELDNGHAVHCVRQTEVNFSELEMQNRAILHQKRQNACTIHDK